MRRRKQIAVRMSGRLIVALAVSAIVAGPVAAHDPAVSIEAEHGAVFDPLYPMTTGSGIWSRLPDDQTRMASTTKTMTADVVLELAKQGVIDLEADVTISATAAGTTGSSLDDIFGNPIRTGEVIRLRDLLYGLMIPSGNNAAVAIAEHVAGVLFDDPDEQRFVELMNTHAATLGLTNTFYTNAAGFANSDATGHHTTARDNARLWHHAMQNATFRDLVRPRPTMADAWTFNGETSTGATTTYSLQTGVGYPRAEGWKNGGRNGCGIGESNQFDAECFVMSAKRLGRQLVAAGMQSVGSVGAGTGDPAEIMDLAYTRLFHPDDRGRSLLWGAATRHALACPASGRALSAVLPATGTTRLASWATALTTESYVLRGTGAPSSGLRAEGSTSRDVDVIALSSTRAITATRVGTSVELRAWSLPSTGAPVPFTSAIGTRAAGVSKAIELVRLSNTMFATAAITHDGKLALKSWRLVPLKGLVALDGAIHSSTVTALTEIDVARSTVQSLSRFVTVAAQTTGTGLAQSWSVDPTTGEIDLLGSRSITRTTGMSLTPVPAEDQADLFPDASYALVGKRDGGLAVFVFRITWDGSFASGPLPAQLGGGYSGVEAAGFGTNGLVAAVRMSNGTQKLIVWELRSSPASGTQPLRISTHQTSISGAEIETCRTPSGVSEGDVITAFREGTTGSLRIRGWRIAARPFAIPGGG